MATRALHRGATNNLKASGNAAPVYVDSDTNTLKVIPGGFGSTAEYDVPSLENTAGTVTQATGITTGVTLNAYRGAITTVTNPSIAAGAESGFAVTNSKVSATSVIVVNVATQFSDGEVVAYVKSIGSGTFTIGLTNVGAAAVSAGAAVINFAVL